VFRSRFASTRRVDGHKPYLSGDAIRQLTGVPKSTLGAKAKPTEIDGLIGA
jgi:hypothetical protein